MGCFEGTFLQLKFEVKFGQMSRINSPLNTSASPIAQVPGCRPKFGFRVGVEVTAVRFSAVTFRARTVGCSLQEVWVKTKMPEVSHSNFG